LLLVECMEAQSKPVPMLDVGRGNGKIREALLESLAAVIDSGRFLFGPDVTALEQELAKLHQVKHAIGCASGSDALLLALMALDVGPGDEVIVPSFTFFATASCVSRLGAKIVFADICPCTFNIDPIHVESLITSKTRAIIPVHLYGQSAAIDRICQLGDRHGIAVIEDAAQAIAAAYHSRPVGSWGQMGCLSFYPTKNLGGMGDGGMLLTNDDITADRLRLLGAHGMRPRYYHHVLGINSRLDTFQAAVLRVKLQELPAATVARQSIAARYTQWLREAGMAEYVRLPHTDVNAYHVWNQYAVRVLGGRRDSLRQSLQTATIGSEVYYPVPLHQQRCFQHLGYRLGSLPETEQACAEVCNLPIYPELTIDEQSRVVDGMVNYFKSGRLRMAA
jgi:dTDP-4-amino-4,6-dideoxygalactose transaminase